MKDEIIKIADRIMIDRGFTRLESDEGEHVRVSYTRPSGKGAAYVTASADEVRNNASLHATAHLALHRARNAIGTWNANTRDNVPLPEVMKPNPSQSVAVAGVETMENRHER